MIPSNSQMRAAMHLYRVSLSLVILMISLTPGVAATSRADSVSGRTAVSHSEANAVPGAHHALYAELLGSGIFYSLNYEYRLSRHTALRGGGGFMKSSTNRYYSNMLLMAMYLSNDDGAAFEFGAGGVGIGMQEVNGTNHFGMAGAFALGYRYQPFRGGVILRLSYTPFYYKRFSLSDWKITYWRSMVGLSMGYAF
jgi:hypothetical protein